MGICSSFHSIVFTTVSLRGSEVISIAKIGIVSGGLIIYHIMLQASKLGRFTTEKKEDDEKLKSVREKI